MRTLTGSLQASDKAVLGTIAQFWGVEHKSLPQEDIIEALEEAMTDEEKALAAWDKLDDEQRGTLQTLIGGNGKMPSPMFNRMFGEIRKMGRGQLDREQPLKSAASIAEGLFYRGLIFEVYEQAQTGARPVIYVPPELAEVLPTHKTTYDDLEMPEPTPQQDAEIHPIAPDLLEEIRPANTTLVDDMTTLLAYLQINRGTVEGESLIEADQEGVLAHCINDDPARLTFLLRVGISAGIIEVQEGVAYPKRAETRRWLEANRTDELKTLADSWLNSAVYRDLWHVRGLHPEPTGWPYDPVVARKAVLDFMQSRVPQSEWWGLDEFIVALKMAEPDFQRPGGDYDSWYIRNDAGEYLRGFESWDAVEGALLEYYLMGPMHWLGLVDLAEDAVKLTAYGRAFLNDAPWPTQPETGDKISVQGDGSLLVSRRVPRFERFQAMRFTDWAQPPQAADDPYVYRLNSEGIRKAESQSINTDHIAAFITRFIDHQAIPPAIAKLLDAWQGGPSAQATLERLMVLRTTSPETMDYINDTPALRRYLGARLGPMAVAVRADQWDALRDALGQQGIEVDLIE